MKSFLQSILLTAILAGTSLAAEGVYDDGLDDALAALKKKRQTTYTDRAVLHEQNLSVPTDLDEEQQALDAQLKGIEQKRYDSQSALAGQSTMPRRTVQRRPVAPQNNNWLTLEMLNTDSEQEESDVSGRDWMTADLDRQKSLGMTRDAAEQNQGSVWGSGSYGSQDSSYSDPAQGYSQTLQNYLTVDTETPESSTRSTTYGYNTLAPQTETVDNNPFSLTRERTEPNSSVTSFSGQPATTTPSSQPFQRTTTPSYGSTWDSTQPQQIGPSWSTQSETETLTPIQRIKKSSSLEQSDPFSDDSTPVFKRSIWD